MHLFDHNHLKIIEVILNFSGFASAYKNHHSSPIISSIHLVTRAATTISDHTHPSVFLSNLNFWYEHVKDIKVDYFITLL